MQDLRVGDVIEHINGIAVNGSFTLASAIISGYQGAELQVTTRGGVVHAVSRVPLESLRSRSQPKELSDSDNAHSHVSFTPDPARPSTSSSTPPIKDEEADHAPPSSLSAARAVDTSVLPRWKPLNFHGDDSYSKAEPGGSALRSAMESQPCAVGLVVGRRKRVSGERQGRPLVVLAMAPGGSASSSGLINLGDVSSPPSLAPLTRVGVCIGACLRDKNARAGAVGGGWHTV